MTRTKDYQADHHELQQLLARELQEYGPSPLKPDDADMVAWHLADITLAVVVSAVERTRAEAQSRGL